MILFIPFRVQFNFFAANLYIITPILLMKLRLSRIKFTAAKWQSQMLKADFADSTKCAFFCEPYGKSKKRNKHKSVLFFTPDCVLSSILPHTITFTHYTSIYRIMNSLVHSTDTKSQSAMCLAPGLETSKATLTFCPSIPHKYPRFSVVSRSTGILRHFQGIREGNNMFTVISRLHLAMKKF